jgi:L-lactate dehydrogenase complex protein LldG
MSSKEQILAAVRKHSIPPVELPSLENKWIRYPDVAAQFAASVAGVGGQVLQCSDIAEVGRRLNDMPEFANADQIYSELPDLNVGNIDLEHIADPHELANVDFAIFQGEFGVAENGAVWLSAANLRHRVAYFIPQHLAVVISTDAIVHNMHEAYERLQFTSPEFGLFMSGPSKTADIEQSLVIGAHGARSLHVFTIGQ